jgi:hypothetical protein
MEPQIKKGALVRAVAGDGGRLARWTYALAIADSGRGARGGSPFVELHADGRTFTRLVRHVEVITQ